MRALRVLAIAAIAAGLATCSQSTAPKSPLEGAWIANLPSQAVMSLHLTVADTVVTGSGALGTLTNPNTLPLTVYGRYVPPNASLSLYGTGDVMTLAASLAGSTLTGTLNGGSYTNLTVTFNKH